MWILLLFVSTFFTQNEHSFRSSIQMVNEQEILLEQMVKEYSYILSGVYYKNNRQYFNDTQTKFEEQLSDLIHGNETKNISVPFHFSVIEALRSIKRSWKQFKTTFGGTKFKRIHTYHKKLKKNLETLRNAYFLAAKEASIDLESEKMTLIAFKNESLLAERLVKTLSLYLINKDTRSNTLLAKDRFQASIQDIIDVQLTDAHPNFVIVNDIQSLWKSMDETLVKVLYEGFKDKVYLMNIHKTETLIIKRIADFREREALSADSSSSH